MLLFHYSHLTAALHNAATHKSHHTSSSSPKKKTSSSGGVGGGKGAGSPVKKAPAMYRSRIDEYYRMTVTGRDV